MSIDSGQHIHQNASAFRVLFRRECRDAYEISNCSDLEKSRSRNLKDCVHRGLGRSLNKQKPIRSAEAKWMGFFAFVIQMHCLLLLYQTNLFDMDAGKMHNFIICRFVVSLCQSLSITLLHSLSLCKPCALWMPELFCFIHIETFAIY